MKFLLIANPHSGPKRLIGTLPFSKVAALLLNEGHTVTLKKTEHAGHAIEISRQATEEDYDVIVAIGGDGTVNEVATGLLNSNKTLGIVPAGSGNGLARELDIPLDIEEAAQLLIDGNAQLIDTCTANDRPFFCTCGMGFDASVSEAFAKSDLRGPLTYVVDALQVFVKHKQSIYTLQMDQKETVEYKAFLIACANASQYGNNAFIAPNASLSDGLLDVTIIKGFPLYDAPQIAIQLFNKGLDKNPYTDIIRAKELNIKVSDPVSYHLDGDYISSTYELNIKVNPLSLKVITQKEL